jgi:RNA polymerase sigma-70 factor (ECF subfamily)
MVLDPNLNAEFASTQWSLVLQARQRGGAADQALAALCRLYWYPIYAYLRRKVGSAQRAEDLTQEFFVRFLDKEFLTGVDRDKGRFRAFLLACCNHFLANQADRDNAQKRGGHRVIHSLDFRSAEQRYLHEPADTATPERLFERRWALTLLDAALARLRREFIDAGKEQLFDWLKASLTGDADALPFARIATSLGMSEDAVKKAAQRLRQRYGEVLREQIAATLDGPESIEDEIRSLFTALGA